MDEKITTGTLFDEVVSDGYLILSVIYELSKRSRIISLNNLYKLLRLTFNIEEHSITYLVHYLTLKEIIRVKNVFSPSSTELGAFVSEETLVFIQSEEVSKYAVKNIFDKLSPFHKEVFRKLKHFDLNRYVSEATLSDMLNFNFDIL